MPDPMSAVVAPTREGFVEVSGVRTRYYVYGDGTPAVLPAPAAPTTLTGPTSPMRHVPAGPPDVSERLGVLRDGYFRPEEAEGARRRGGGQAEGARRRERHVPTAVPTVFLLMPDVITHAAAWKAQVPFLARHFRVITADPRGNGGSDRVTDPAAYQFENVLADAWAVLDEVGSETAVLCGVCSGAGLALIMAAERPERVQGVVAINPGLRLTPPHPWWVRHDFEAVLDPDGLAAAVAEDGWARVSRQSWTQDWPGFAQFFFEQLFPEPHSTKQIEDCVGWAGPTGEVDLADEDAPPTRYGTEAAAREVCEAVRCPVLVITGSDDRCQVPERGRIVAELTGGEFVELEGSGHLPMARDPVRINLLLRDFVRRVTHVTPQTREPTAAR